MAVHIRLRRMGKKKRPFYRIVAADSRRARDGRFLEVLGTYDPIEKPAKVTVKEERLTYWLGQGAETSDTVGSLLTQIGFTEKYHQAAKGQDVSAVEVKNIITERKKKTRKTKKTLLVAAEAAATEAKAKADEAAAKAKAKADEAAAKAKAAEEAKATEEKSEEASE